MTAHVARDRQAGRRSRRRGARWPRAGAHHLVVDGGGLDDSRTRRGGAASPGGRELAGAGPSLADGCPAARRAALPAPRHAALVARADELAAARGAVDGAARGRRERRGDESTRARCLPHRSWRPSSTSSVETLRSDGPSRERLVRQVLGVERAHIARRHRSGAARPDRAGPAPTRHLLLHPIAARAHRVGLVEAAIEAVAACGRAGSAHVTAESLLRVVLVRIGPSLSVHERDRLERSAGDKAPAGEFGRASVPPQRARGDEEVAADGLLVDDAGLVLLHPFLPQLFDALGLAQGGRLLRPERALLLLRHLATGALDAEEHELVFAKVLCGLPIEERWAGRRRSPPRSRARRRSCWRRVVRHWDALGKHERRRSARQLPRAARAASSCATPSGPARRVALLRRAARPPALGPPRT